MNQISNQLHKSQKVLVLIYGCKNEHLKESYFGIKLGIMIGLSSYGANKGTEKLLCSHDFSEIIQFSHVQMGALLRGLMPRSGNKIIQKRPVNKVPNKNWNKQPFLQKNSNAS